MNTIKHNSFYLFKNIRIIITININYVYYSWAFKRKLYK